MKISKITDKEIVFNNGRIITFDHDQDCCEWNYADFNYLKDEAGIMNYEFPDELDFEVVEGKGKYDRGSGFRFGDKEGYMFFVPCYSEQNGYYTCDIDIYYMGEEVLSLSAEFVEY